MSLEKMMKKAGVKPTVARQPVWEGPDGKGKNGGISFSLLSRYLVCKERFRIYAMEGLRTRDQFNSKLEFGNMWHICEEMHKRDPQRVASYPHWYSPVESYATKLCHRYRSSQEDVQHWYNICKSLFPVYVNHWSKHPEAKATPLFAEQVFDVPYKLPSERMVRLRGKWDGGDLLDGGVWLQENKSKSQIDSAKISQQLTFDMQTIMYLITLQDGIKKHGDAQRHPIKGVRYNVVRRSAHKSTESMLKKVEEDRSKGRIGEWFSRWNVEVHKHDIEKFKTECLHPVLENLCDDYEWWEYCNRAWGPKAAEVHYRHQTRNEMFPKHCQRHFRFPYGIYNPLTEGGSSELDWYLQGKGEVGLERTDTLFPELADAA